MHVPGQGRGPAVAADLGLGPDDIDQYGRYKAKLPLALASQPSKGRLVLV